MEQLSLPVEKRCTGCAKVKSLGEFAPNKAGKHGRYSRCRECHRARDAKYRAANVDQERARHARYSEANREKQRAWQRAHYAANKERVRASTRAWELANPGYAVRKNQRRRARLAAVTSTMTRSDVAGVVVSAAGICAYCLRPSAKLTVDHVTPLARGGHDVPENCVAACHSCNSRKRDRGILWMLNRCASASR